MCNFYAEWKCFPSLFVDTKKNPHRRAASSRYNPIQRPYLYGWFDKMIDLSSNLWCVFDGVFDEWPEKRGRCGTNRFTTSNSMSAKVSRTRITIILQRSPIIYNAKGCVRSTKFSIYLSTEREIKFWTFSAFDWPSFHVAWRGTWCV